MLSGADPHVHPAMGPIGMIAHKGNAYAYYADLVHCFPTGTSSLVSAIAGDIRGDLRAEFTRPVDSPVGFRCHRLYRSQEFTAAALVPCSRFP